MTRHQKIDRRISAILLLVFGSVVWWGILDISADHANGHRDALALVVISAIASIASSLYLLFGWKKKGIWIRLTWIERQSDPVAYWLAMLGFFVVDSAFLYNLAWDSYALLNG